MVQGTPCSSVRHTQGIMKYSLERERKCKDSQQHTRMESCSHLPAGGNKPSDGTGWGRERVSGGRGRCEDGMRPAAHSAFCGAAPAGHGWTRWRGLVSVPGGHPGGMG